MSHRNATAFVAICFITLFSICRAFSRETLVSQVSISYGNKGPNRGIVSYVNFPTILNVKEDEEYGGIQTTYKLLKTGATMQMMSRSGKKSKGKEKTPLLFIHGSFHAAWCWAEHYMPYFADLGHDVVAISLRGTGGTPALDGAKKVTIDTHVTDLNAFLDDFLIDQEEPIIIAHSFGGILAMKYLEIYSELGRIRGLALLSSVPPSGNGKMTMRFLTRSLTKSWKITAGFAFKKAITDASLCRELFFESPTDFGDNRNGLSDEDIVRVQTKFRRDSAATIDLVDLSKKLPSDNTVDGVANFIYEKKFEHPSLVVGAYDDFIVDKEGIRESALYLGIENEIVMIDSSHDVMLGLKWRNGAVVLENWLSSSF